MEAGVGLVESRNLPVDRTYKGFKFLHKGHTGFEDAEPSQFVFANGIED